MWLKKCTCFLLACVAVFGCLFTPVAAAELGEQKVEIEERRASGKFDFDIPAKTLMKASSSFPMEYGETVTITASYTPASASMDFGLIDSDGTFYPVRANNGSINQTIRIDLRGNYTFAIRNNSSYLDILSFLWVLVAFTLMKKDHIYNGLPVCAICERVNRYTVKFSNMLTLPVTYGKMSLDRKGCGRR